MAAKVALDQPPASGEICIAEGQCPKAVQVIGHDHDGIDREGMTGHRVAKCLPQQYDVVIRV